MNSETYQEPMVEQRDQMLVRVPITVLGLSMAYSGVLGWLERRYPIKPDHTWAEVAGGVLITLVPVALEGRRFSRLDWRVYEETVWRCFFASGVPIILWQLGEQVVRHLELMRYAAIRETRSEHAHHPQTLASRGGAGAGRPTYRSERVDPDADQGPGDA